MAHRWTRREAAFLIAAWAIALTVGLVILELLFGGWLRSDPWERAHALHIVVDRRMSFDASDLYPGGGDVAYTRDRYGLRGSYGDVREVRILTVGGSSTDQRYLADGQTWQDALQAELARAGIHAPVANAGVDGHSTFAHLAAYRDWFPLIPGLAPRYTILYVGLNDLFLDAPRTEFDGGADGSVGLKARIKGNSALFRLYNNLRGLVRARQAALLHSRVDFVSLRYTAEGRVPGVVELDAASREGFGRRFEALLGRVKASGSIPVCVTQPSMAYRAASGLGADRVWPVPGIPGGVNGVDAGHLFRARNAVMERACVGAGAPFIDLFGMDWEVTDFYDFLHNTPAGAKKVGERLGRAMKQLPF
jgi:hypothetical protein